MSFLAPAGLWMLAALAGPLAIHLWRRPPRTVPWGSLRFLTGRSHRWQTLRWREHVLLITRLALLTVLSIALAHPIRRQAPFNRPQRWVLLDPAAAPAGPSLARLRAWQVAGAETRLLAPGFPRVGAGPANASASTDTPDLWSLWREAEATLPAGSSLAVLTPGRLASLRGIRPALSRIPTEWIDTPAAVPTPTPLPTPAPARPLTVLILHEPDRAEDARFLAAAWNAVAAADHLRATVSVELTTAPLPPDAPDWICWLAAQPIPPSTAARAANLLEDAAAPAVDAPPGWIVSTLPPVRLWRRGLPTAGSVFWTDSFGQPLLTRTHDAHGARWHFASRFHPAWNDLPLSGALAAGLRTVLADPDRRVPDDQRIADSTQLLPSSGPSTDPLSIVPPGLDIDLRLPFWLSAIALFALERLLSHRRAPHRRPVTLHPPVPA